MNIELRKVFSWCLIYFISIACWLLIITTVLAMVGCKGVQTGDSSTEINSDSNNDNSVLVTGDGSGRICIKCESEQGLESLGYDVEGFINCTDQCGLTDANTPEEIECDKDCIEERLKFASEVCRDDNGCEPSEINPEQEENE